MKHKVLLRRSAIAKDLGTPKYRSRVVRDKKHYTRKGRRVRDHQNGRGLFLFGKLVFELISA